MKKKIILLGILFISLLFVSSCKKVYLAAVTIINDGDIVITASVDGDFAVIPVGDTLTWELQWEGDRTITVHLYAEPIGYNDFDEAYITLGNGEEYTWTTGWIYVNGASLAKKHQVK